MMKNFFESHGCLNKILLIPLDPLSVLIAKKAKVLSINRRGFSYHMQSAYIMLTAIKKKRLTKIRKSLFFSAPELGLEPRTL